MALKEAPTAVAPAIPLGHAVPHGGVQGPPYGQGAAYWAPNGRLEGAELQCPHWALAAPTPRLSSPSVHHVSIWRVHSAAVDHTSIPRHFCLVTLAIRALLDWAYISRSGVTPSPGSLACKGEGSGTPPRDMPGSSTPSPTLRTMRRAPQRNIGGPHRANGNHSNIPQPTHVTW